MDENERAHYMECQTELEQLRKRVQQLEDQLKCGHLSRYTYDDGYGALFVLCQACGALL